MRHHYACRWRPGLELSGNFLASGTEDVHSSPQFMRVAGALCGAAGQAVDLTTNLVETPLVPRPLGIAFPSQSFPPLVVGLYI